MIRDRAAVAMPTSVPAAPGPAARDDRAADGALAAAAAAHHDIAALILAGGAGTRVGGRDKGLIECLGRPLVAHAVARLREAGVTRLAISANRHREQYEAHGPVVADRSAGYAGPLAGLVAGLDALDRPLAITIPVDVPAWPAMLVACLRAALRDDDVCLVAHDGAMRQPLFALYRRAPAAAAAARAYADGVRAVRALQDLLGAREIEVRGAYDNLNHEEQYA